MKPKMKRIEEAQGNILAILQEYKKRMDRLEYVVDNMNNQNKKLRQRIWELEHATEEGNDDNAGRSSTGDDAENRSGYAEARPVAALPEQFDLAVGQVFAR